MNQEIIAERKAQLKDTEPYKKLKSERNRLLFSRLIGILFLLASLTQVAIYYQNIPNPINIFGELSVPIWISIFIALGAFFLFHSKKLIERHTELKSFEDDGLYDY